MAADSAASAPLAAAYVEPVPPICSDSAEAVAMQCAPGVAMRSGDTIVLRLTGVGAAKRVDVESEGDGLRRYRYVGHFGGDNGTPGFHILDLRRADGVAVELVNAATGDSLVVPGLPILSPAGARFAAVADRGSCELPGRLEIWRVTGDAPVREYALDPFDCAKGRGWGASEVRWLARDTVSLLRTFMPASGRDTVRALLVRAAGEWTLDTTRAQRPR